MGGGGGQGPLSLSSGYVRIYFDVENSGDLAPLGTANTGIYLFSAVIYNKSKGCKRKCFIK